MSDSTLDSDELEAIQASLRSTSTPRRTATSIPNEADATPMTLIASERDARSARPRLLGLATPWIKQLDRSLKIYLTNEIRIELVGAEIIDGRSLRDELRTSWTAAVRPPGKLGAMLVTVGGPVVEVAAARRCGSQDVSSVNDTRDPSPVAIKLFEPAGHAIVQSLSRAWKERENADIVEVPSGPTIAELLNSDIVICMTLAVAAPCGGRIRLFSTPTTAAGAAERLDAVRAEGAQVARALDGVPVELTVVLGTVEISLSALANLAPGATFTLPTFVDSPVPIYCAGVLKAFGRPVVTRGVIAVEIDSAVTPPARGVSK